MHKRYLFHGMAICLAAFTLSSCTSLFSISDSSSNRQQVSSILQIHQGQSQQEVTFLMKDNPQYRRFTEDGLEEWEYRRNCNFSGDCDVIIIAFREGRVVSMDSYRHEYPQTPTVEVKKK